MSSLFCFLFFFSIPLVNQRWLFLPNSLYWHYSVLFPPTNAKVEVEVMKEVFIHSFIMYLSIRFYENEPDEICSYLSEKGSKGRFFAPNQLENHTSQGKERGKPKSEEHSFRLTEEVHFKTPARYIFLIFSQTNSLLLTLFTTLFISTGSPFYGRIRMIQ